MLSCGPSRCMVRPLLPGSLSNPGMELPNSYISGRVISCEPLVPYVALEYRSCCKHWVNHAGIYSAAWKAVTAFQHSATADLLSWRAHYKSWPLHPWPLYKPPIKTISAPGSWLFKDPSRKPWHCLQRLSNRGCICTRKYASV